MVKRNIKEKLHEWVDILRSGEYEQGRGYLRQENKEGDGHAYCCLGVALEHVLGARWLREPALKATKWQLRPIYNYCGMLTDLDEEHQMQLGLSSLQHDTLIKLNDTIGCSFKQIANYLKMYVLWGYSPEWAVVRGEFQIAVLYQGLIVLQASKADVGSERWVDWHYDGVEELSDEKKKVAIALMREQQRKEAGRVCVL